MITEVAVFPKRILAILLLNNSLAGGDADRDVVGEAGAVVYPFSQ